MAALRRDDAEGADAACLAQPGVAQLPFLPDRGGDAQPALCAAACLGCGPDVFAVLLEHGAAVQMTDMHGKGPLGTLAAHSRCHGGQAETVAALLHGAGASPIEDDCSHRREAQQLQQTSTVGLADALASAFEASRPACTAAPPWLLGDYSSGAQLDFSAPWQKLQGQ